MLSARRSHAIRSGIAPLIVIVGLCSCATNAVVQVQDRRWVGCYELQIDSAAPELTKAYPALPRRLELTLERHPGYRLGLDSGYVIRSRDDSARAPTLAHWRPLRASDSIAFLWSTGQSGWAGTLSVRDSSISGHLSSMADTPGHEVDAAVRARRYPCESRQSSILEKGSGQGKEAAGG